MNEQLITKFLNNQHIMKLTSQFYAQLPNFETYHAHIITLFEQGKTTGENQSEAMLSYTKLALARTRRGLKTFKLLPELIEAAKNNPSKKWFLITEAWCGDAGNIIPLIQLLAKQIEGVTLKVMIRDEHPEIMENFLTNGGKAIPIFVLFDEEFKQIKKWGPRPAPAQKMVLDNKISQELSYTDLSVNLQKWYQKDKTLTLQKELIEVFNE